jgi:hypothetical protein
MKKLIIIFEIMSIGIVLPVNEAQAQIDVASIIKAGVKKVITAIDLKIQRLQNKTIWLQNAQKAVENTMSKIKLDEITTWVEKQKTLYQNYFNELRKVKTVISYYYRIRQVTSKQLQLVAAYKNALALFKQDKHFTSNEINYMISVYSGILDESVKNLDQIVLVITSFSTQMDDAKRLQIIDASADAIEQNYTDLLQFNQQNISLSLHRSKDLSEINQVRVLYGLQ